MRYPGPVARRATLLGTYGAGPVTRHGGLPGTYGAAPNGARALTAPGATRP
jgi:hypothetical protein